MSLTTDLMLKYYEQNKERQVPALAIPGTTFTDGNTGDSVTATDYKPGLYDYVSGRFFVNQGTGSDFLYYPIPTGA